jgi:MFS family permease
MPAFPGYRLEIMAELTSLASKTAVFIFHADHSLVLATHPSIGSEFNALEWSSWLFTSFGLAGAATQAVFGKLSDIYGRKPIILLSYAGFAIGWYVFHSTNSDNMYWGLVLTLYFIHSLIV